MFSESTPGLLEFDKLLESLAPFAHSDVSRKSILGIRPLADREKLKERTGLIEEIRRLSQGGEPLGLSQFEDLTPLLLKVKPSGAFLDPGELSVFIPFLSMTGLITRQVNEAEDLPLLKSFTGAVTGHPGILKILRKTIGPEKEILDTASQELSALRSRIRHFEGKIKNLLQEIVRDQQVSLFLQDDFMTKRSGRWVIPVRMDSKKQIPGVVHDISRSGETVFVEPLPIIHLSNELENLTAEEKAEEIRILKTVTAAIRDALPGLEADLECIVSLDVLYSIAVLADLLRMETPVVSESGPFSLFNARHPLLSLIFGQEQSPRKIVPLDVTRTLDNSVMVITGPNAGGKTLAIKTIGLLSLMALSGMPIPANSSSQIPFFGKILVDIGDEQSIENSHSTFSAHIANLSGILQHADSSSLVLLDELGTGTNPEEGAALACAVLTDLHQKGSLVFATTHLSDIKGFVQQRQGMLNASMEFDEKTLTPTYRLRIGSPGRSHALDIASRYGLPERIIASAKKMMGGMRAEIETLISDLNEKRTDYEQALERVRSQEEALEERGESLKRKSQEIEERARQIVAAAYREAGQIIADIKRQMHSFLEEAKKREKSALRDIIRQTEQKQEEISQKVKEYAGSAPGTLSLDGLQEGDKVFVHPLGRDATVVRIDREHQRLRVRTDSSEIDVPLTETGPNRGAVAESSGKEHPFDLEETTSPHLNIIGMRVDEALSRLEPFLNHAVLSGLSEVTVIHGLGTGALSRAVKEHIEGHPLVKSYRKGKQPEGGAGVTVVTLLM